jgi:SpoVK/Ycf46/Vps4 family AAA+-type ATPase
MHANETQINSEVIIDFNEAYDENPSWRPIKLIPELDKLNDDDREWGEAFAFNKFCKFTYCCTGDDSIDDYELEQDESAKFLRNNKHLFESKPEISEDDYVLLPDRINAYLLVDRKWATLSTSPKHLLIDRNQDPWLDLVLPLEHKETIEALVTRHLRGPKLEDKDKVEFEDFVAEKGRGKVILLHGPPGTGKTSTAECIAIHMNKPLYALTSGNLGTEPDEVDENLVRHFQLADKWGCILLLDEADVFLQRRRVDQININAVVSVFLRQLEYYNGILFLTTNMVGVIDPAFRSRIHIILEYKPLSLDTAEKIWRNRLDRVRRDFRARENKGKVKEDDIIEWARKHHTKLEKKRRQWNGRYAFPILFSFPSPSQSTNKTTTTLLTCISADKSTTPFKLP